MSSLIRKVPRLRRRHHPGHTHPTHALSVSHTIITHDPLRAVSTPPQRLPSAAESQPPDHLFPLLARPHQILLFKNRGAETAASVVYKKCAGAINSVPQHTASDTLQYTSVRSRG
jgi:hypothetical protein